MKISAIIKGVNDVAEKYDLQLVETDRTDNIISLKLLIDHELFSHVIETFKRRRSIWPLFSRTESFMAMTLKGVNFFGVPLSGTFYEILKRFY